MIGEMQEATVTEPRCDTETLLERAEQKPILNTRYGNPWAREKDGKQWVDRARFLELMRK